MRDQVLEIIRRAREPLSTPEILHQLDGELNLRTLRRWLQRWVETGEIQASGRTRDRKYFAKAVAEAPLGSVAEEGTLSFSQEALSWIHAVRRPLHERLVAGYEPNVLHHQVPILTENERKRLAVLGATSNAGDVAGTYARAIHERLLIDLAYSSSRLEGNTYTKLDTKNLIELGRQADGKDAAEAQMVLNHKQAIEMMIENADMIDFDRRTILNLHGILAANLLVDPSLAGALRTRAVGISSSTYTPLTMPQKLAEAFDLLLAVLRSNTDPFEQALLCLLHIPYLQPFIDVNKRVSRLAANISLIKRNLKPISFVDVPRDEYIHSLLVFYERRSAVPMKELFLWAYERSAQSYTDLTQTMQDPDPFRLAHHRAIYDGVAELVRSMSERLEEDADKIAARHFTKPLERARFAAIVVTDVQNLHEGNFMRFGLRGSEWDAWNEAGKDADLAKT